MLEGTDLSSAYQHSLVGNSSSMAANSFDNSYASYFEDQREEQQPQVQRSGSQPEARVPQSAQVQERQTVQTAQYSPQNSMYDASVFNKQYDQEQRIMRAIQELKKRKEESVPSGNAQPSYFDKLFGKKKEIGKILQASLIIVLGLSVYFLIDHYLKEYLSNHDLSFERQLFLRLLYPLSILFIIWNLRVFVK